jgi:hypothetical protein
MSRALQTAFRMCSRKVRYARAADAQRDQPGTTAPGRACPCGFSR